MICLTRDEILLIHERLIERYGGSHGVRDENLLESALNIPFQSFGGVEFYPTVLEKAVRLCFGLVKNHPFIDANKRSCHFRLERHFYSYKQHRTHRSNFVPFIRKN